MTRDGFPPRRLCGFDTRFFVTIFLHLDLRAHVANVPFRMMPRPFGLPSDDGVGMPFRRRPQTMPCPWPSVRGFNDFDNARACTRGFVFYNGVYGLSRIVWIKRFRLYRRHFLHPRQDCETHAVAFWMDVSVWQIPHPMFCLNWSYLTVPCPNGYKHASHPTPCAMYVNFRAI